MNLKEQNLNKPKTKENKPTKTSINLNSKFQILTSDARGITLIALVITIIVMLILVAVTIRVATEGNLFRYAGNAVKTTKNAVLQENYVGEGKIQVGGTSYNSIDEYVATKTEEESAGSSSSNARILLTSQLPENEETFSPGAEVYFPSLPSEIFFVLSDDGTNMLLLAKYCLSKTASEQLTSTATYSDYGRRFSNNIYWSTSYTGSPFDLQSEAMLTLLGNTSGETVANNAILKAKEYGETLSTATGKTVTGRLMTYQEANSIKTGSNNDMKKILWGKWTAGAPTDGCLYWWIGAADSSYNVWNVNGSSSSFDGSDYSLTYIGVRPVLEI